MVLACAERVSIHANTMIHVTARADKVLREDVSMAAREWRGTIGTPHALATLKFR
jgi:hypothetical protein